MHDAAEHKPKVVAGLELTAHCCACCATEDAGTREGILIGAAVEICQDTSKASDGTREAAEAYLRKKFQSDTLPRL